MNLGKVEITCQILGRQLKKLFPIPKNNINHIFDADVDKTNEYNFHFASIGKTSHERTQEILRGANLLNFRHDNVFLGGNYTFRPQSVDTESNILTIKNLNETRSVGSDGIPLRFIKDFLYVMAFCMTFIINTSMVTGVFSTAWKHALVVSLLKSGDATL